MKFGNSRIKVLAYNTILGKMGDKNVLQPLLINVTVQQMAKSIRSKWKRKCRAVKRIRYGEKELARLKKTLGINEKNQDVEMSNIAKIATVIGRSEIQANGSNAMDIDKKRVFNPKTMRDQNGSYPVWMHQHKIRNTLMYIKGCENKDAIKHSFPNPTKYKERIKACQSDKMDSLDKNDSPNLTSLMEKLSQSELTSILELLQNKTSEEVTGTLSKFGNTLNCLIGNIHVMSEYDLIHWCCSIKLLTNTLQSSEKQVLARLKYIKDSYRCAKCKRNAVINYDMGLLANLQSHSCNPPPSTGAQCLEARLIKKLKEYELYRTIRYDKSVEELFYKVTVDNAETICFYSVTSTREGVFTCLVCGRDVSGRQNIIQHVFGNKHIGTIHEDYAIILAFHTCFSRLERKYQMLQMNFRYRDEKKVECLMCSKMVHFQNMKSHMDGPCFKLGNVRIDALNKDNFDTWKIHMEALLIKNDGWNYVNGNIKKPELVMGDQNSQKAIDAWNKADSRVKSDIILSITPSEAAKNCVTSRDVWLKLESTYQSKGPARNATLLKRLTLRRMSEGSDVPCRLLSKTFHAQLSPETNYPPLTEEYDAPKNESRGNVQGAVFATKKQRGWKRHPRSKNMEGKQCGKSEERRNLQIQVLSVPKGRTQGQRVLTERSNDIKDFPVPENGHGGRLNLVNNSFTSVQGSGITSYSADVFGERKDIKLSDTLKVDEAAFSKEIGETALLEIIHTDVCGPMRVKSLSKAKYFVEFVDDYSRYTTVYFVITKDEVLEKAGNIHVEDLKIF
ncbi:hypothetical protein Trydic_g21284 [Trypoxylus dichotomus]